LWLNLLTDGLLGLGLGLEPTERNVMRRPPYSRQQGVFSQGMGRHVVWVGALIGAIALAVGYGYWVAGRENWQTMVFTTLAFAQIAQALAVRSLRESLFSIGLLSNKPLAALAAVVFALQLAVVYVPFLQDFFQTHPLTWADLGLSLALAGLVFIAIEVEKWLIRRRGDRGAVRGEGERQAT
jgi:Ca2+-transporting ATPase